MDSSSERPIVLAPRRAGAQVADAVAPRSLELGIMLPYPPLHHLLLADCGVPLVMTSGNVSDEPIACRDGDAVQRLPEIADMFLLHDRPIETRTDDSVLRTIALGHRRRPFMLRRSRGFDARELVRAVWDDVAVGVPVPLVAVRFHNGLASATALACPEVTRRRGAGTVVLSGGTFQNRRLLEGVSADLASRGLRVLTPERLPPGDGGISFGQAAVAAARGEG